MHRGGSSPLCPIYQVNIVSTRLFFCYSERLHKALKENGFKYLCIGWNQNTGSKFWLYEGTPELNYYKDYVYPKERDKFRSDYKENVNGTFKNT